MPRPRRLAGLILGLLLVVGALAPAQARAGQSRKRPPRPRPSPPPAASPKPAASEKPAASAAPEALPALPPGWPTAPPLPSPTGRVVRVASEPELQDAVRNVESGTTILVAPGTYRLTNTLHFSRDVKQVALRGAAGRPEAVVLVGRGMANEDCGNVPHGVLVSRGEDVLIADLTIRDVYNHPIAVQGPAGQRPRIYHCRLIDAGEQFIKANPSGEGLGGVDGGRVEYTVLEYTRTCRGWYTNGVDVHKGRGWTIRHCLFRNFRAAPGAERLTGPAVLMWRGSSETVCEANLFLDCEFGIAFGMEDGPAPDHSGGLIRNNILCRARGVRGDYGIGAWNSPGTKVLHNTVLLNGTYPNAIETRFAGARNVEVAGNLTDSAIVARDGASGRTAGNCTAARPDWFADAAAGDLHLTARATGALDQAAPRADVPEDFDGQPRPLGGKADLGADELDPAAGG